MYKSRTCTMTTTTPTPQISGRDLFSNKVRWASSSDYYSPICFSSPSHRPSPALDQRFCIDGGSFITIGLFSLYRCDARTSSRPVPVSSLLVSSRTPSSWSRLWSRFQTAHRCRTDNIEGGTPSFSASFTRSVVQEPIESWGRCRRGGR